MPTATKAKGKPWTEEQKQAARDAYQQRQREKGEEPVEIDIDALLARIKELEERPIEINAYTIAPPPEYDFEVWQCTGDTKNVKGQGDPCRWRHFHQDGVEWVYHEKLSMWCDSGYTESLQDKALAMVSNAFGGRIRPDGTQANYKPAIRAERIGPVDGKGDQTYSKFPPFATDNLIEVIVRVRRA